MSDNGRRYPYHEGLVPPYDGTDEDWCEWAQNQPFTKACGAQVIECSAEQAVYVLEKSPIRLNPNGALFGGLVPALADAAAGAIFMRAGERGILPATVQLSTEFMRPAFLPLTLTARMRSFGRSIAFCDIEIANGDGRPSNHAQVIMSVIPVTD